MADEATLKIETHIPIPFNKATGTAFEKGAFVTLADNLTVTAASADGYVGGIVHREETADQANATVSVYRGGIFQGTCSAAITVGQTIVMTGTGNKLKAGTVADLGSKSVGIALESTSTDGDTFLFELTPGVGLNALS